MSNVERRASETVNPSQNSKPISDVNLMFIVVSNIDIEWSSHIDMIFNELKQEHISLLTTVVINDSWSDQTDYRLAVVL